MIKVVALNLCVACGSDNIMPVGIPRLEKDAAEKEIICSDMECRACGTCWTVEYRPAVWYGYDRHGCFIPAPYDISPQGG